MVRRAGRPSLHEKPFTCRFRLFFFFLKDTAPAEIYPLSLHAALPIGGWRMFAPLSRYSAASASASVTPIQVHAPGCPWPSSHTKRQHRSRETEAKPPASQLTLKPSTFR